MDKRIDEGMKHLMRAVKLDPQLPHAWYRLAWSEKEKGHFELALKHYKKAVDLKPSDEKSRLGVGAMLSRLGKNRAAEKVFEALAKAQPRSVEAWLNLGKTRALLKQLNCIEAFERVLLLDPDNPEAQRLLAMVRQLR
jgi:tetratricopeptide (TPR) repeat protein